MSAHRGGAMLAAGALVPSRGNQCPPTRNHGRTVASARTARTGWKIQVDLGGHRRGRPPVHPCAGGEHLRRVVALVSHVFHAPPWEVLRMEMAELLEWACEARELQERLYGTRRR